MREPPSARVPFWRDPFWWRWIAANGVAELVGLGSVALIAFLVFTRVGPPVEAIAILAVAAAFVALGAVEGAVVGFAQARVLRSRVPALRGWVRATVFGAMAAWAVGMIPSTAMRLGASAPAAPAEEPGLLTIVALATGLGLVAGPILAAFQWLRLRTIVARGALVWLPANAAAWALGMPVIFVGTQADRFATGTPLVVALVAASLFAAGAVVGAVHGTVLVRLVRDGHAGGRAA